MTWIQVYLANKVWHIDLHKSETCFSKYDVLASFLCTCRSNCKTRLEHEQRKNTSSVSLACEQVLRL